MQRTLLSLVLLCGCDKATEAVAPTVDAELVDTGPTLAENLGVAESEGDGDCENLNAFHCLFPYPSDAFRAEGRVAFRPRTLPTNQDGEHMDPKYFAGRDGFSPSSPIMFSFKEVTASGVAGLADVAASLADGSPTVIVDTSTGQHVAHWAELDHFTVDGGVPVMVVRPVARLAFGTRYVVAVRKLVDKAGQAIPPDPGFAALRDRTASTWRGVHARREHFDASVFPVLEAAGVAREDLQLAFDFTTASEADATGLLLAMRDVMLAQVGADGPEYTIDGVDEDVGDGIARLVRGTAHIPSFLEGPKDGLRTIRRDATGAPVTEGVEDIPFEVQIPSKAFAGGGKVAILQYGHGLFGSRSEARKDWLRLLAERHGFAVVAIDMQGMSSGDEGIWANVLAAEFARFPELSEKVLQGLVNHFAVMRMMVGRFAADTDPRFGGVLDKDRAWYYGNSQGGTYGGVMMSLQTDVTRGVLGVPGGDFSMLLDRSAGFSLFAKLISSQYPDPVDLMALFGLAQLALDPIEPLSYVTRMTAAPFPGTPAHRVLMQVGKEDAQVENQVSFLVGRTIGVSLMTPAVRKVYGLAEAAYPFEGNALVEYDFGMPENPKPGWPPPEETDTHELVRRLPQAQDQLVEFLETGIVKTFCEGTCNPD